MRLGKLPRRAGWQPALPEELRRAAAARGARFVLVDGLPMPLPDGIERESNNRFRRGFAQAEKWIGAASGLQFIDKLERGHARDDPKKRAGRLQRRLGF